MTDDRPLRILFHHRIASRDGQAVHMEELIAALRRQGHSVALVGPRAFAEQSFGGELGLVAALKRRLPAWLYELLELGYSLYALGPLAAAYLRFRPDAVYERFSLFMLAGLILRRATGVPYLLEVNSPLYEERAAHDGLSLRWLGRLCQRALWRGADVVLPVTHALAAYVRDTSVPDARIRVIANGVDPDRFAGTVDAETVKGDLGLDGRVVLGFTGFVKRWNRLDQVLRLMARAGAPDDLHLLLVGDGPARAELEDLAASLGLAGRLTVTGVVDRDAVQRYAAAFDIALLPGVTPYSSPLKMFEYMALGRAIVAPNSANIREILTDGRDARLFDPDREDAFAEAILALARDAALRDRLGACARDAIHARSLTWDANAERVATLVRRHAEQPAVGRARSSTAWSE